MVVVNEVKVLTSYITSDVFRWVVEKPCRRVFISTYSITKNPQTIGILESIGEGGKKGIILVNDEFRKTVYEMRGIKGVIWVFSEKIHAKIMMADSGRVAFGSGNLTAHAGRRLTWDVMCLVESMELYKFFIREIFIPAIKIDLWRMKKKVVRDLQKEARRISVLL